jgi:hypothetical protein
VTFRREFVRRGTGDISYIRISVQSIPDRAELKVNVTPVTITPITSAERFQLLENDAGASLPVGLGLEAYSQAGSLEILLFGAGHLLYPTVPTFYATPASDI